MDIFFWAPQLLWKLLWFYPFDAITFYINSNINSVYTNNEIVGRFVKLIVAIVYLQYIYMFMYI